ncbi:MAG: YidC/Oxa1 family membrane protein insertase [Microthrixaceae bacterium]
MFDTFFNALAKVLDFFFRLVPSGLRLDFGYGFSIMALTVAVMILITPLTVKSTRSMLQMQRMQPEMKRIQEKYKNDRETLNAELMAFYRENQINPLGGCLPMLAQAPVFFIMYRLIEGLTVRQGGLGSGLGQTISNQNLGNTFKPWILNEQFFHPQHLDPSMDLYKALAKSTKMNFLGMDLSLSASQALQISLVVAIPFLALLLIMLATGLFQNRQLRLRNTSAPANPQQQMIMKFMPFFLPIFSFGFPAGMALYWCTQNLCRIGTNSYITRSVYRHEHPKGEVETTATEKSKSSKSSGSTKAPTNAKAIAAAKKKTEAENSASKSDDKRGTGSSPRSKAAQKKQSGEPASAGSSKSSTTSPKVNPRRSGETRRGSQSKQN